MLPHHFPLEIIEDQFFVSGVEPKPRRKHGLSHCDVVLSMVHCTALCLTKGSTRRAIEVSCVSTGGVRERKEGKRRGRALMGKLQKRKRKEKKRERGYKANP